MKTYTIPFSYTVNATIEVQASGLDHAINKVMTLAEVQEDGSCRLIHGFSPVIKSDIDVKSIEIDEDKAEELNPKKTYTVRLVRTQTVEVEVEAHTEEEAERVAIEGAEDGSLEDFSYPDDEEIVAEDVEMLED
jgi:hypothetical protein